MAPFDRLHTNCYQHSVVLALVLCLRHSEILVENHNVSYYYYQLLNKKIMSGISLRTNC